MQVLMGRWTQRMRGVCPLVKQRTSSRKMRMKLKKRMLNINRKHQTDLSHLSEGPRCLLHVSLCHSYWGVYTLSTVSHVNFTSVCSLSPHSCSLIDHLMIRIRSTTMSHVRKLLCKSIFVCIRDVLRDFSHIHRNTCAHIEFANEILLNVIVFICVLLLQYLVKPGRPFLNFILCLEVRNVTYLIDILNLFSVR